MAREVDLLGAAIAATEGEIFGEAFGKDETVLDETGDRSMEEMGEGLEGQHEPEDEDDEESAESEEGEEESGDEDGGKRPEKEPEPTAKKPADQEKQEPTGRVPAGRLREQTERTRAVEAERDALKAQLDAEKADAKRQVDALNAKFDGLLAALQRQQPQPVQPQPEPKPDTQPDLFEDPKGFADHLRNGFQAEMQRRDRQIQEMRIETSMQVAHARHGDAFQTAYQALIGLNKSDPENIVTGQRILSSPNPGEALMQWHRRNEVLRQVGDDPAKYREQIAEETRRSLMQDQAFRKQLIDELRAEAAVADGGRPRTMTRIPGSLNRAAGNNASAPNDRSYLDGSDGAIFDSAFDK